MFETAVDDDTAGPPVYIRQLTSEGASVHAFDVTGRRVAQLDLAGSPVSEFSLVPGFYSAGHLSGGRLIVNAAVKTPELAGISFHILDLQGRVERSFGENPSGYKRGQRDWYQIAVDGNTIWTAAVGKYELRAWDQDGTLLHRTRRQVEWFPDVSSYASPADPEPRPGVLDFFVTTGGKAIVLIEVPDQEWREGIEVDGDSGNYRVVDWAKYVDTIVEIFDLETLSVEATSRFDRRFTHVLSDSLVASYETGKGVVAWMLSVQSNANHQ